MLKGLLLPLMNLALAGMAMAQNLVPNPSFEDTVNCGIPTPCLLDKAVSWYNPTASTPDVWDCDLTRVCGFGMSPDGGNNLSYQYSFDGTRHAGAYYWFGPGSSNTRDYMGVRLNGPLASGAAYEVALHYARRRNFTYAVDHIGVWFGADSLWQNTTWWLTVEPQLRLRDPDNTYLTEGDAWTRLVDTLVAQGGEQWMVIGNFEVASAVNGVVAEPDAINAVSYYFIDQVSVEALTGTGSSELQLQVWWEAGGLGLSWPKELTPERIIVHDAAGRVLSDERIVAGGQVHQMALPGIAEGLYVVRVSSNGFWLSTKIIKGEVGL